MALVNRYILRGLENYISKRYDILGEEYSERVNELLGELEQLVEKKKLDEYIERIDKIDPNSREGITDAVVEITNLLERLERIYLDLLEGDGIIPKIKAVVDHYERELVEPFSLEILIEAAKLLDDYKQVIGNQTIEYHIYDLKDLPKRVESMIQNINWQEIRAPYIEMIASWRKKIEEAVKNYHDSLIKKRTLFNETLNKTIQKLVEKISKNNIPVNEIYQVFIDTVKRVSNIHIDLEVVVPNYEYDLLYTQYLDTISNEDLTEEEKRERLLTILFEIKGFEEDYYQYPLDLIEEELSNYFN